MPIRTVARPPAGNVAFPPTSPPTYRGGSPFRGVFDGLAIASSFLGAWSFSRRLRTPYSGPLFRARRATDSTERDFYGIGPQGEVSTAELRAWNGWNLLAHSDNPDGWTNKVRVTFANNSDSTWDGQSTADKIIANTTNDTHFISQVVLVVGTTVTMTVEAKFSGIQFLAIGEGASHTRTTYFDLQAGAVSTSNNAISASITPLANGWYRCSRTWTVLGSTTAHLAMASANTTLSFAGNNVDGITVARLQLERASFFTTYEPRTTTGAGDSFLVTLYDQSGLARHFTQSTTTLQPIICEQGVPVTENGRLAAKFVAADARRMSIASSTAMFNALHTTGGTVLCVSRANDTAAQKVILRNRNTGTANGISFQRGTSEEWLVQAGRTDVAGVATNGNTLDVATSGLASTSQTIVVSVFDPDNATANQRLLLWQNGTASSVVNATTGTPFVEAAQNDMTLGAVPAGSTPHDGTISEVALFSAAISTADRTAWQSRSGVFYTVTIA